MDIVYVFQNLNKQAYDLAKALLKRTAQAIEPYITNVSLPCNWLSEGVDKILKTSRSKISAISTHF